MAQTQVPLSNIAHELVKQSPYTNKKLIPTYFKALDEALDGWLTQVMNTHTEAV
jgi:hypothetical protein